MLQFQLLHLAKNSYFLKNCSNNLSNTDKRWEPRWLRVIFFFTPRVCKAQQYLWFVALKFGIPKNYVLVNQLYGPSIGPDIWQKVIIDESSKLGS